MMCRFRWIALVLLVFLVAPAGCGDDKAVFESTLSPVHTDLTHIKDFEGRYMHFRGVNVGGSTKVPVFLVEPLENGRDFTYVGRPFPLDDAEKWFAQLRDLGFNSIRLLYIWEAVFPDSYEEPDTEFLDYFERIIELAGQYGIYVLINCHENMWSRHLWANYNEEAEGTKGEIDNMLWSLLPDPDTGSYTDRVAGDGAPLWATKVCLPEKTFYDAETNPNWGTHHIVGRINDPFGQVGLEMLLVELVKMGLIQSPEDVDTDEEIEAFAKTLSDKIKAHAPESFDITETTDMLPFTFWGTNNAVSLDMERCYAQFFAGDTVYPDRRVVKNEDGEWIAVNKDTLDDPDEAMNVKDFLQSGFINAWVEIAKRAKKHPNVIGYDLMNEPVSIFLLMTAAAAYFDLGLDSAIESALTDLLPEDDLGKNIALLIDIFELLPPTTDEETRAKWGFEGANLGAMAGLNIGFEKNFLQPLYERLTTAILEEDPEAKIWLEPGIGVESLLGSGGGLGGQWQQYMTGLAPRAQYVYTPHWYPDIYPNIGFNMPPRTFALDEYRYRDYTAMLKEKVDWAAYALANVPAVFGEFGTYWNFKYLNEDPEIPGWKQSRMNDYAISAEVLDNYYEGFEDLFLSNMVWCFTADNDPIYGDWWNHEDFSIVDDQGQPRGEEAYSRPYPRALSGKPISMHFYSPLHYFDPDKGQPNKDREFELVFASKETDAPTIIFVPPAQYAAGFYVWLSDGWAAWDNTNHRLYYYPEADEPEWEHTVRIQPPIEGEDIAGWNYFIKGENVVSRN